MSHRQIDFISAEALKKGFVIVGDGQYAVDLYRYLVNAKLPLPEAIYVRFFNPKLPQELLRSEEELENDAPQIVVLGTNTFHLEMLGRIESLLTPETQICDLLMQKAGPAGEPLRQYFWEGNPISEHFVLLITHFPAVAVEWYLKGVIAFLREQGIDVFVRHPMQNCTEQWIENAKAIIVWNGSTPSFEAILEKIKETGRKVTFAECGFFPQRQHFYFDKCGVNADSQIKTDDLKWLKPEHFNGVQTLKKTYFQGVKPYALEKDYVFVPLQVPNDSNVLMHSTFNNGMQEFIDLILQKFSDEKLIFKAHPKDRLAENYQVGEAQLLPDADTKSLILGAKKVVGINSSVLYEAALAGVSVECYGDTLLTSTSADVQSLLAAVVARQFNVEKRDFSSKELRQFSWLGQENLF